MIKYLIFKRILLIFLIGLQFILGIFREKVALVLDSFFEVFVTKNENFMLRPLVMFFQRKIPVFLANFGTLYLAPFFLLLTLLCLSVHFHWKGRFFFKLFVFITLLYFFIATVLIFTFTAQPILVHLWHDFTDIYFSPLLLIFLFFIFELRKQKRLSN